MNLTFKVLLLATVMTSSFSFASIPKIHCKGVKMPLYEVILQEGKELTSADVEKLPKKIKKNTIDADKVSNYTMTIFRGEAVPQTVKAIGIAADVHLEVLSLSGSEALRLFLDELSPDDISSTLTLDGRRMAMSCDVAAL